MNWIVVQTKSNCENKAHLNLVRQGFKCFLPKILKAVMKFNKLKEIYKPLFPGYIFVSLEEKQNWSKINYTFGVNKILKVNERLCYMPIELFKEIRQQCDSNGVYFKKLKNINEGDDIKYIKSNKFIFDAKFVEFVDAQRSYIFLDFLKRKIKVKVNNNQIIV